MSTLARPRIDALLVPLGAGGYLAVALRAGIPSAWLARSRAPARGRRAAYTADWLGVSLEECPDN